MPFKYKTLRKGEQTLYYSQFAATFKIEISDIPIITMIKLEQAICLNLAGTLQQKG